MKHIKLFKIVFLLCSLVIFKIDAEASDMKFPAVTNQDSLVLKEHNGKGRVVIQSGDKIKLRLDNGFYGKGEFKSMHQDTLTFLRKEKESKILVNSIETIQVSRPIKKGAGSLLKVAGVSSMVIGTYVFIWVAKELGASSAILLGTPALAVFGGVGFLIFKGGTKLNSEKFNLKSEWSIEVN